MRHVEDHQQTTSSANVMMALLVMQANVPVRFLILVDFVNQWILTNKFDQRLFNNVCLSRYQTI
jgi:hypothetical protein